MEVTPAGIAKLLHLSPLLQHCIHFEVPSAAETEQVVEQVDVYAPQIEPSAPLYEMITTCKQEVRARNRCKIY